VEICRAGERSAGAVAMIRSMTGFGRGETSFGDGRLSVEVRSVNSRHLDVRVRSGRELAAFERAVRAGVARHFVRGAVDVSLRYTSGSAGESRVEIDLPVARQYAAAATLLAREAQLTAPDSAVAILTLPGVVRVKEIEIEVEEAAPALEGALEQACTEAVAMRQREGEELARELRQRSAALAGVLSEIEARAEEVREGLRQRLQKRLSALAPEVGVDPWRLEQEVVLYAERMDVTEETVRFRSHLAQFHETLETPGGVGRKLEFLLQELGREANTIASKASDAPINHRVVELKTELEKLREQVLNVE
jgi:uncharacterized protein (TIGR00255 family)